MRPSGFHAFQHLPVFKHVYIFGTSGNTILSWLVPEKIISPAFYLQEIDDTNSEILSAYRQKV